MQQSWHIQVFCSSIFQLTFTWASNGIFHVPRNSLPARFQISPLSLTRISSTLTSSNVDHLICSGTLHKWPHTAGTLWYLPSFFSRVPVRVTHAVAWSHKLCILIGGSYTIWWLFLISLSFLLLVDTGWFPVWGYYKYSFDELLCASLWLDMCPFHVEWNGWIIR